MKIRYLYFLLTVFLFACEGSDQIENKATLTDSTSIVVDRNYDDLLRDSLAARPKSDFVQFFSEFQTAVFNEDPQDFNRFIDPQRGVYIIENPGALPRMTLVKDIQNFKREFQGRSFFSIKDRLQSCQVLEETLPAFNCEGQTATATGYSKEGCFAADSEAFRNAKIHQYASLPKNELKDIEKTLPLVQKTVVQTSSSYQFHFGKINGKWKILFIDLRIPCSA